VRLATVHAVGDKRLQTLAGNLGRNSPNFSKDLERILRPFSACALFFKKAWKNYRQIGELLGTWDFEGIFF
jgi:hypothetical protein